MCDLNSVSLQPAGELPGQQRVAAGAPARTHRDAIPSERPTLAVRCRSPVVACVSQAVGPERRFWPATAGETPAATSFLADREFCGGLLGAGVLETVDVNAVAAPGESGRQLADNAFGTTASQMLGEQRDVQLGLPGQPASGLGCGASCGNVGWTSGGRCAAGVSSIPFSAAKCLLTLLRHIANPSSSQKSSLRSRVVNNPQAR